MIFMVPISPFGVFGFVWNDAKGMVSLAYLVGLIGMFFTAMSYASMAHAFPMAGSVYSYVGRGLHEVAGFFADWLALLLVGLLFILQTWVATDLAQGMRFSSPETAFYEIAERAGGAGLRTLTLGANVLACGVANAMVAQAAVARILFAMARDGKLPPVLAKIHPRYQTPYVSTLAVAGISLVFMKKPIALDL